MNRTLSLLLALFVILIFAGYAMVFVVPYDQAVVVSTLGKVTGTYQGSSDAGLKLKAPWPFQSYRAYPAGLRTVDLAATELQTNDKYNIILGLSVQWRISDPAKFAASLDTLDKADLELRAKTGGAQLGIVGRYDFAQLVNADPAQIKLAEIESKIAKELAATVERDYGITVERVAVRRLEFAASTNATVLGNMTAARKGEADKLRDQGARQANDIRSRADSTARVILAFADSRAQEIRAQGDAEAAKVYSTFAKDPKLAIFLRQIEAIEKIYGHNTKFLIDAQRGSLERMLLDGPATTEAKGTAKAGKEGTK